MSSAYEYQNIEFKLRTRVLDDGEIAKKVCIEVDGEEVICAESLESAIEQFDYEQM